MSLKNLIDDVTKEIGMEIRNNEVLYHCPVCHHRKRKLSINIQTHEWKCWVCCKTHGTEGGSMKTLFKIFNAHKGYFDKLNEFGYKPTKEDSDKKTERIIRLPQEFIPLYKPSKDINYRHAMHYLKKRNITPTDIVKYNIGYCNEGDFANKIVFPSYDENGVLNYFTGRTWFDHVSMKYKKPPFSSHKIVGLEFFTNFKYDLTICEGIFDAIAIKRNVVPLYGKILGTKLKEKIILQKPPIVNVVLDGDAKQDSVGIIEWLYNQSIPTRYISLQDKDPSELGYKEIWEIINNSKILDFSDIVKLKIGNC